MVVTGALLVAGCQGVQPSQPVASSSTGPPRLAWIPAVDAVVEAFEDHRVVAIGEIHGSRSIHTFLQTLLGDPRLLGVMNDVAVEFGSARHQATIDRYVLGDDVQDAELELVWTDTTQRSGVWNSPFYRAFFERIRDLNAERAPDDRIRVPLGDPPIDWDAITETGDCEEDDPQCLDHWLFQRDEHFAAVVRDESLALGRRVLVVAGAGHIRRNPGAESPHSLTDELDAGPPGATWVMLPVDAAALESISGNVSAWEPRTVAAAVVLEDGPLADLPADDLFERGTVTCDNPPCEDPNASAERLGAVADALLVP